jgi:two-component system cell cycle sensor histidine kinase/response regulator CckA
MRVVLRLLLAALAYFGSARLGYAFAIPQGVVTLWPPSGVMLGLLAISDRRDWPALLAGGMIGSLSSDLLSGYSGWLALAAAFANNFESLCAAWFLTWRLGQPVQLANLRAVITFTVGAAIATNALTALLGAAMLHSGFRRTYASAWFVWWVGDGLGMLIVAPLLLAWRQIAEVGRAVRGLVVLEATTLLGALAIVGQIALGPQRDWAVQPGPYTTFPLLFWVSLRFGPAGAAAGALIVAAEATWNAALGVGPFAAAGPSGINVAMQVYAFLAVVSLSCLIPAAVIEERKGDARRLVDSEARYRRVVDAASDAIVTVDEQDKIQFANPAAGRIFGYTIGELTGRNLTTLVPGHAGSRTASSAAVTGIHKDGRELTLEVSVGESATGEHHVVTEVLRDTTERRAAESALRAAEDRMRFAMEASRVGVWEVDLRTGAMRWSDTLEGLHGMTPGSFAGTVTAFYERIHPDDRQFVRDEIDKATRQHADSNLLYRTVWPDGSLHWISGVGRIFYDDAGTPVRAAGIGLDVTEHRALEEQYRQSQKMEAIGQLAGGVAHDFNNLLTAIQGYGTMVAQSLAPDSPQQADLAEIRRAADHAASLTRQLLAFSRKQILAPRVLDLSESLLAMEPMLKRVIGEHIEIVVRAAPDAGHVKADPGQIERVVLNLAINARDAMPDGGVLMFEVLNADVTEAYERKHIDVKPGRYVMLAVTDTGVGMDAATAARAFEPFFTTKPQGQGTGLGLSTVYGIVKQSGGSALVYSEPGHGSTFKLFLPRVDEPADAVAPPVESDTALGTETILVVEDDDALRTLTRRILENRGYRVLVAAAPHEAQAIAAGHVGRIDLLLTDVILPEMSGRALSEQLVPRHPGMRVLFMSGYTDDAMVHRGILTNETQFLQKPFMQEALVRKVRETLERTDGAA